MNTIYMADLDGTLVDESEELSHYTKTTINALVERALPFTINTSRTPESVMPVIEHLNLKLPLILMNGSLFYDTNKKEILYSVSLENNACRRVVETSLSVGVSPFVFEFDGKDVSVLYKSSDSPQEKEFCKTRQSYYKNFTKVSFYTYHFVPYIICVGTKQKMTELKLKTDQIPNISSSLFISDDDYCFLEIYSGSAGKWNGAKKFMERYGFQKIVAFGDNLNDTDMIKNADIGVAVLDGKEELKRVADTVIGKVSDDAVANYLLIEWSRNPDMY